MALKDWKKLFFYKGDGYEKKTGSKNGFIYIGDKFNNKNNKYSVESYNSYFGGVSEKPDKKRFFLTKLKALAYARAYMRTH